MQGNLKAQNDSISSLEAWFVLTLTPFYKILLSHCWFCVIC